MNILFRSIAIFVVLCAASASKTVAAEASATAWYEASGTPDPSIPSELLSPKVEIVVFHEHFDDKPTVEWSEGLLINRHIWPDRKIKEFEPITRDSLGEDESPTGTALPFALFPKGEDGQGGEWIRPKHPSKNSKHQQQWDFLAGHLDRAYAQYRAERDTHKARRLMYLGGGGSKPLTDWEKFHAICNYASAWQSRQKGLSASTHPMDVIFYGYHCGGTHNIFVTLFHIAGFEVRSLVWSGHSSTEVKIGDKWVFADMIERGGAHYRSCHGWAEISAEPHLIKPAVLSYVAKPVARKTTYLYDKVMYWNFHSPRPEDRGKRAKTGLGLRYRPSTASALYPELRQHLFLVPKGSPPSLTLCGKESWSMTRVPVETGQAVRKRFYVSDCRDNPITKAVAKFAIAGKIDQADFGCFLDGQKLDAGTVGNRTLEFQIPPDLLTPGEHELVIKRIGGDQPVEFYFYYDILRPYHAPISGQPFVLSPTESENGNISQ